MLGGLYQQVLPQYPIETYIHVITGVFGYHTQVLLERRLISDTAYRTVPLAVIVTLPMAISHMKAQGMAFQVEVLRGGLVEIGKLHALSVPIDRFFPFLSCAGFVVRAERVIWSDGQARPPFALLLTQRL